jgi:hypothetical protein
VRWLFSNSAVQGKEATRDGSQKKRSYKIYVYVHGFAGKLHLRGLFRPIASDKIRIFGSKPSKFNRRITSPRKKRKKVIHRVTSVYVRTLQMKTTRQLKILPASYQSCSDNPWRKKYFDNFVFIYVNCGLLCSGARRRALTQTIGNARELDIN